MKARWVALALALLLGPAAGCNDASVEDDEAETDAAAIATTTDARAAVATPWGTELWVGAPDRPAAEWPGVFDQPQMKSGPGACGFAASANLTAQLSSRPGAPRRPISPWDALDRASYSALFGIHPVAAARLLDGVFADRNLVGAELAGTRFTFRHVGLQLGWGEGIAWRLLRDNLDAGKPFIALVNYNGDGGWLNFAGNHYVVVVAVGDDESVVIAHWGRYEVVDKSTFMRWWSSHTVWSYSGIFPDRASLLGLDRAR